MTDAEIFHEVTKHFGGPLHRETLPEAAQEVFDETVERGNDLIEAVRRSRPELPRIHFGLVLNGAINAVAFKSAGRYFIGLNSGIIFMLRLVIGRMLSDKRLFKTIGNPNVEDANEPLSDYFPDAEAMYTRVAISTPKDDVRRSYAWFLQDQAIMFFVGHEIAHISRGHVDYLAAKRGAEFASELEWFGKKRTQEELFERQCLEQDADRRSIISRIDSLRITYIDPTYCPPPWGSAESGPAQLIFDWWVSVNVIFRLFGDVRFTRSDLETSNYPPLPLRRAMCEVASFAAIMEFWDSELKTVARQALEKGRNQTESAFAAILGETPSFEGLKEAFSPNGVEHAIRLEEYWNTKMVERLRPFSYEF